MVYKRSTFTLINTWTFNILGSLISTVCSQINTGTCITKKNPGWLTRIFKFWLLIGSRMPASQSEARFENCCNLIWISKNTWPLVKRATFFKDDSDKTHTFWHARLLNVILEKSIMDGFVTVMFWRIAAPFTKSPDIWKCSVPPYWVSILSSLDEEDHNKMGNKRWAAKWTCRVLFEELDGWSYFLTWIGMVGGELAHWPLSSFLIIVVLKMIFLNEEFW